ncbi:MAG: hypothetical protein ACFHX7_18720 [Pseudomonadota bacterium]
MTAKSGAQSGAVTLIQRFGWSGIPAALNLNPHFHMLYLNGVYDRNAAQPKVTSGPSNRLLVKIWMLLPKPLPDASRGFWKKQVIWSAIGRPPRESEYLDLMQDEGDAMGATVSASITYRLAFCPNAGLGAPTERR